jgi:PKD repeat protein
MGDEDWTDCWTEWDPINADYANSINYSLTPGISFSADGQVVSFTGTTAGAVSYAWDFGDGNASDMENPVHTYADGANFSVSLTVTSSRGCVSSTTSDITLTSVRDWKELSALKVYPNPSRGQAVVDFGLDAATDLVIQLLDVNGKALMVTDQRFQAGQNRFELDAQFLPDGIYFLRLGSETHQHTVRLAIVR